MSTSHWYRPFICLLACLLLAACSGTRSGSSISGPTYTVKRGDTLSRIAQRAGSSVGELARMNNLSPPYTIMVGQQLQLSGGITDLTQPERRTAKATPKATPKASASGTAVAAQTKAPVSTPAPTVAPANWPAPGSRCWRWPTTGKVSAPYSSADGGNKGIDIAGQRGQAIYAAAAGRVVYAGDQLRGYGNLILIKHDEDYITAYGHNDTMLVKNGQDVKAGQQIATMGSTGSDSVKLHFQIRYRATALDPQRYLPAPGKSPSC